jgi:hypothetical protein
VIFLSNFLFLVTTAILVGGWGRRTQFSKKTIWRPFHHSLGPIGSVVSEKIILSDPLGQFEPNFDGMVLGWSPFRIVSNNSPRQPRWLPLLKIGYSVPEYLWPNIFFSYYVKKVLLFFIFFTMYLDRYFIFLKFCQKRGDLPPDHMSLIRKDSCTYTFFIFIQFGIYYLLIQCMSRHQSIQKMFPR